MNRANNTIFSIIKYLEYKNHVASKFSAENISNFKIFYERKKISMLNFLSRLFLFTLLIWILLCSNNWDSCTSRNYESNLKKILYKKTKRSLAESINLKESKIQGSEMHLKEVTKYNNQEAIIEEPLLLSTKEIDSYERKEDIIKAVEEKIDIYQEKTTDNRDKSKRKNLMELLNMLKSNKRLSSLCGILLLPFIIIILSILELLNYNYIIDIRIDIGAISTLFLSITMLLTSLFLIHK